MSEQLQLQTYLGMPALIASEAMRQLLLTVERAALTDATILILGESGSGKELVARAVHQHSLRCSKPWVDLTCAALPEHLIESELFGYEKGAFSGADATKPGLFEMASGGTLFLDEVGELEPRMQVKLLRVLDGVPYYRLGGTRKVAVDVRVIAATNQDLEEATKTGKFRQDLYHRLSQITLRVPALRHRPEDIAPLAGFFLSQQGPRLRFAPDALEALRCYSWPGNVRELRNVVIRTAVLARDELIHASGLPPEIQSRTMARDLVLLQAQVGSASEETNLESLERRMILQVLSQTGGHRQQAAVLLGISRRTLSRKLKLYGIEDGNHQFA